MLLLNPRSVSFGAQTWSGVTSVSVDRDAERLIAEIGPTGPHVVLADVAEQRVRVKVVQEMDGDDLSAPEPGDEGAMSFTTSPNASAAGQASVSLTAVVTGVRYEVSRRGGAVRTVSLLAVSSDGVADPVSVQAV